MAQSANALLIRANPDKSILSSRFAIAEELQLIDLQSYGSESAEVAELRSRFRWQKPREAGKFYDAAGSHTWYFYMYGDAAAQGPFNCIASTLWGKPVKGDIVIVKSGPAHIKYDINITKDEVVDAVAFYQTKNPSKVFMEREAKRAMGSAYGGAMPAGGTPFFSYSMQGPWGSQSGATIPGKK